MWVKHYFVPSVRFFGIFLITILRLHNRKLFCLNLTMRTPVDGAVGSAPCVGKMGFSVRFSLWRHTKLKGSLLRKAVPTDRHWAVYSRARNYWSSRKLCCKLSFSPWRVPHLNLTLLMNAVHFSCSSSTSTRPFSRSTFSRPRAAILIHFPPFVLPASFIISYIFKSASQRK